MNPKVNEDKVHKDGTEAKRSFLESFREVVDPTQKRWMAVVWEILPDGSLRMARRTTWQFPVDRVPMAMAQLGASFDPPAQPAAPADEVMPLPLPRAKTVGGPPGQPRLSLANVQPLPATANPPDEGAPPHPQFQPAPAEEVAEDEAREIVADEEGPDNEEEAGGDES